jgi:hypothetical protein
MTDSRLTRRTVFAVAAGFLTLAASAASALELPVRAIRVSGHGNRDLARIAPMVAQALAHKLGQRYAPGARGGSTLVVDLTVIDLPVDTSSDFVFSSGYVDVLKGTVAMLGGKGGPLQQFPLMAQTGSMDASDSYPDATDRRLSSLADTYAYWVVSKLE